MSERILHRSVIVGGAAALALSAWLVGRASAPAASEVDATAALSNVAVDCEPTQQALIRQIDIDGTPRTAVQCVTPVGPAMTYTRETSPVASPALVPAVYRPTQPVRTTATAPVAAAPVRTVARPVQTSTERAEATSERSWKQRALVIGGSAGAGAGIGALIGGKKGALIGAAVGGGGGTLYEVVKH